MPRLANFLFERKLKKQGYKYIAGCDEVGCGAWAGPVFAAAIILSPKFRAKIRDSKQLSEKQRKKYYKIIKQKNKLVGLGFATKEEIDSLGLSKAKNLATKRAIANLPQKPEYVLFDGKDILKTFEHPYKFIIKGDEKIKSIACASIIAKVERDRLMEKLAKKYPRYQFNKNKGYGTKKHILTLRKYGPCKIHRFSYKPIKKFAAF
ncbi:MAG: ribonuclease HII [Patescibacteria group bacterium]